MVSSLFRGWSEFLTKYFKPKCPFQSRPVKELQVLRGEPNLISHCDTYNGNWYKSVVTMKRRMNIRPTLNLAIGEFEHPERLYNGKLPISNEKFKDLQDRKKFVSKEA